MRRYDERYKDWREAVLRRFDYECNRCDNTTRLHAHHVKSWDEYPELRYSVYNGECVCRKCHEKIHPFMREMRLKKERKKRKKKKEQEEIDKYGLQPWILREEKRLTEREFLNNEEPR